MKLEQQEIFDVETGKWFKIIRPTGFINRLLGLDKRLVLEQQIYLKVRKLPTGNHLYFDDHKKLHYRKRGPPPITPSPKTRSLTKEMSQDE